MEFVPGKVHLFFEQSGTFKNVFIKQGISAIDYDIEKGAGTDVVIDLFGEILDAFSSKGSKVFDEIKKGELVFAFFPCTYFTDQSALNTRADLPQMKGYPMREKLNCSFLSMNRRAQYYELLCRLCILSYDLDFPLIIENPCGRPGFLSTYFPIKNRINIMDRRIYGDRFKKPTQFFFVNCEPSFNLEKEFAIQKEKIKVEDVSSFERSIISPAFAENFIKSFVL